LKITLSSKKAHSQVEVNSR